MHLRHKLGFETDFKQNKCFWVLNTFCKNIIVLMYYESVVMIAVTVFLMVS